MIIFNHPLIETLNLIFIKEKIQIQKTLPRDFLILENNDSTSLVKLAKYCQNNNLNFSAIPKNTTEALLLVNLNARYLLTKNLKLAKTLQKLAEVYLFDAKILLCITEESKIQKAAKLGIDGVIFV